MSLRIPCQTCHKVTQQRPIMDIPWADGLDGTKVKIDRYECDECRSIRIEELRIKTVRKL